MITFKKLIAGSQLTTSAATYYTAGTGVTTLIKAMSLLNTSSGAVTVTVHLVNTGSTETDANMILDVKQLGAGETYTCPEAINQVLSATGTIRAFASSGSAISLQASGIEIT